ncbi:MAG: translation initiation factor IF-2 [Deltaproteobacteria bacterium]|nr:translation initiation factor IF-2 [Deltaproteobacteria bacterium]
MPPAVRRRVYEVAKEVGLSNVELVQRMKGLGINIQNHMSIVEPDDVLRVKRELETSRHEKMVERRVSKTVIRWRAKKTPEQEAEEKARVAAEEAAREAEAARAAEAIAKAAAEAAARLAASEAAASAAYSARPASAGAGAHKETTLSASATVETSPAISAVLGLTQAEGAAARDAAAHGQSPVSHGEAVATDGSASPGPESGDLVWRREEAAKAPEKAGATPFGGPAGAIKKKEQPSRQQLYEMRERMFRQQRAKKKLPRKAAKQTEITTPKASKRVIKMAENITVAELAAGLGLKASEIIKKLFASGVMATLNQSLDADTATLIANDFGYEVQKKVFEEGTLLGADEEVSAEALVARPPVVTVMGHVDHGKTSLLDAIRKTRVAEGEAGGITQHIGAYRVPVGERVVTFLDTPGHEAFTAMRARGAKVTDIVILVVAADDGVMPQTEEAIHHAREAKVPIIVALNKIDKPEAAPDRVKQELAKFQLVSEDWGGDTLFVPVSARQKKGIDELLDAVLLQAEVLDLKANPDRAAIGSVVEAKLEKGRGPLATILIKEGTLKLGDVLVSGVHMGKVRALTNDRGESILQAGPGEPAEVLGLSGVPSSGDSVNVVADEKAARQLVDHRLQKSRETDRSKTATSTLDDLYRQVEMGEVKELKIVIKADVHGSVEALTDALSKLSTEKVKVQVIHGGVGGITETDVMLAAASRGLVVGFGVRPEAKANQLAERERVEIRLYNIIYDATQEIRKAMEGLLAPTFKEKVLGRVEVRQIFHTKAGTIAGSSVTDGKITRSAQIRLLRDNVVVHTGRIGSLRRFKDDVREVQHGYECGIVLDGYSDLKPGDIIEAFELEAVAATL